MDQRKNIAKRPVPICLTFFIILASLTIFGGMNTEAAVSYSGRGSKSDPYIIETAAQLNGIRDNLKAHYKLGNTIDLASFGEFKRIGNLKSPFKGSLSCDLGSDGKPLYAIKNFKQHTNLTGVTHDEKYTAYKDDKSHEFHQGFFGAADGASFTNILLLDADVSSNVEGWTSQNSDFSPNKGYDEQGTGALVGIGKGITIKGCGVSGKLKSPSNCVGGIAGELKGGSTVTRSWATITVDARATYNWGSGGLVGTANKVTIKECWYNGTTYGAATHAGAFAGSVYTGDATVIQDCWAAGTVVDNPDDSYSGLPGCFLGTKNHTDGSQLINTDVAKQCYTAAAIEGRTQVPGGDRLKNANYALKSAGVLELGFFAATMEELNTAFTAFSAWTVKSGTLPQLKNVIAATDSSAYKPGTAAAESQGNTGSQGGNSKSSGGTASGNTSKSNTSGTSGISGDSSDSDDINESGDTASEAESGGSVESGGNAGGGSVKEADVLFKMRTSEKVLIGIISALILLSVAGSAVTVVLILKKRGVSND